MACMNGTCAEKSRKSDDFAAICAFLECYGISETVEHMAVSELQAICRRCKCSISYQSNRHLVLVKTRCFLVKVVSPKESPRCILGPMAYTTRELKVIIIAGKLLQQKKKKKAEFYPVLKIQLRFRVIFF